MTVAVKNKKPVLISPTALRQAGFKSGDKLELKVSRGTITILPKGPAQDDEYTPAERRAIDRGIAQSEKEHRDGKTAGPFNTAADFVADLHRESAKLDAKKRKPARR
jgi:hypothetical protein